MNILLKGCSIQDSIFLVIKYFLISNYQYFDYTNKLLNILKELKLSVVGVIENMKIKDSDYVKNEVEKIGFKYLGSIGYDWDLEEVIGDKEKIIQSNFMKQFEKIVEKIK